MSSYDSIRPLLFKLSPELAHKLTIEALHTLWAPRLPEHDSRLGIRIAGIGFPTPVGLAAGFDKDAKAPGRMLGFGFGSVEIGTVTPYPQPGNAAPRAFRLKEDQAIINRFGFNSAGHDAVAARLHKRRKKPGVLGVNLGANKSSLDKIQDYLLGIQRFAELADYLTINVSSPNTPGLRSLQGKELLQRLTNKAIAVKEKFSAPPIFLKVSPDLKDEEIRDISRVALDEGLDGLIVGNTTVARPSSLVSKHVDEEGGLSGAPLKPLALAALRSFWTEVGAKIPLIGVGGISSAQDAYERIKAGASLIQLYTALAYKGPGIAFDINEGLLQLLDADGYSSISEAVGSEYRQTEARVLQRA